MSDTASTDEPAAATEDDGSKLDTSWAQVAPATQGGDDVRAEGLSESAAAPDPMGGDVVLTDPVPQGGAAVEAFSTGGGWYQFPDGYKVQGRDSAQSYLDSHPQS